MAVGSSYEDHLVYAEAIPSSRLFFAGEATDDENMGSVPGGLLSGQRAAKELTEHFLAAAPA